MYLTKVYSYRSCPFTSFALFGLPLGPIVLDVLMFLEPLHLMCLLPCMQLRYLLPAYRATRTLLEVTLEGLPQSVLQAYIFYKMRSSGEGSSLQARLRSVLPT